MAARLERNYRYSLGEDIRRSVKNAVLLITLAGKGENRAENIRAARLSMLDTELSLRLLSDLKVLPDKRYVYYMEMVEDIIRQLSNWERSLSLPKCGSSVRSIRLRSATSKQPIILSNSPERDRLYRYKVIPFCKDCKVFDTLL